MKIIRQMCDATDPLLERWIDTLDLAPIVIIEPGDTERDIIKEIGFSPLVNRVDGERFPSSAFTPNWEMTSFADGWWEQVYVTGDDGSGVILLVPDDERIDPELLALGRQYRIEYIAKSSLESPKD